MALPGIRLNVVDGNLGMLTPGADKVLVVGHTTLGTSGEFASFSQPNAAKVALGGGPAVTAACHVLDMVGAVDVLTIDGSVAASSTAVTKVGTGGDVTVAGNANDVYKATIRIVLGGANGVGRFDYTLDGVEYGAVRTIPANGTFVIPGSGLTATFDDEDAAPGDTPFVAGATYSWTSLPKTSNGTDLDDAADALLAVDTRWKAILWAVSADTTANAATLAAQIGGIHDDLADQARMTRGLVQISGTTPDLVLVDKYLDGSTPAEIVAAMSTFGGGVRSGVASFDDIRIAPFAGMERLSVANPIEGFRRPYVPVSFSAAGRVARFTRATNIGWVGGGRLEKVSAITFDERKAGEQLHDVLVNSTTTHIGRNGAYFVNGLLKAPVGSDFRYLSWGLAFDLLTETVHDGLLPFVNSTVRVNANGTIHELDATRIDGLINALIRAAVLDPVNEQGFKGFFTDAQFAVDRSHNVLTSKKLLGSVRGVPLANLEGIEVNAGLFTALVPVEALDAAA
jgi:hypothetical protein